MSGKMLEILPEILQPRVLKLFWLRYNRSQSFKMGIQFQLKEAKTSALAPAELIGFVCSLIKYFVGKNNVFLMIFRQ
jgi:hypothetical protein